MNDPGISDALKHLRAIRDLGAHQVTATFLTADGAVTLRDDATGVHVDVTADGQSDAVAAA